MKKTMKKVLLIIGVISLLAGTSCIEDLVDPDLKELEPFLGKWNVTAIEAFDHYMVENEAQRNNEREYKNVSGYLELTKAKDADDSYRRGKYSLTFTPVDMWGNDGEEVTVTEEFKWDIYNGQTIYVELDDSEAGTLGVSQVHIDFVWASELSESRYVFGITVGGDVSYLASMVEFSATK